jgi:hypothetical protein
LYMERRPKAGARSRAILGSNAKGASNGAPWRRSQSRHAEKPPWMRRLVLIQVELVPCPNF